MKVSMHALRVKVEERVEAPQAVDLLGTDVTVGTGHGDEVAGNQFALRGVQHADSTLDASDAGLLRQQPVQVGAKAPAAGLGQVEGAFEPFLEVLLLDRTHLAVAGADGDAEVQQDGRGGEAVAHGRGGVGLAPEHGLLVMGEIRCADADVGLEANAVGRQQGRDGRRVALGQLDGTPRAEDLSQADRRNDVVAIDRYGFQHPANEGGAPFAGELGRQQRDGAGRVTVIVAADVAAVGVQVVGDGGDEG